ncbi:MAG: HAD family hydrolase [Nocardioidaceae bacterium]
MTDVARLAMWSGPRNISTALMRSWENRADSLVVDEPLYGHYLSVTGVDHPGRDEVLAVAETDWRCVVARLLREAPSGVAVVYQKHMAHHLTPEIKPSWLSELTNVLLIRDPREVVASYLRSRADVTLADLGLQQQVQLYDELAAVAAPPMVIDSADFLQRPADYLRALCDLVRVPFTERMLRWPAGPRDTDGVWARYWYDAVCRSTGFAAYEPRDVSLTGRGAEVAEECWPLYERLRVHRWRPNGLLA